MFFIHFIFYERKINYYTINVVDNYNANQNQKAILYTYTPLNNAKGESAIGFRSIQSDFFKRFSSQIFSEGEARITFSVCHA